MEDGKSSRRNLSDSNLSESDKQQHNATTEEFLSNKKGKEQPAAAKETKKRDESIAGDDSMKSFEGLSWRNKNKKEHPVAAKETRECDESIAGDNSLKSFEGLSWRDKNRTGRNREKEVLRSNNSSRYTSSTSSYRYNWRSKDLEQEQIAVTHEIKKHFKSAGGSTKNSFEGWNWRNKNGTDINSIQPCPRFEVNLERRNQFRIGERLSGHWSFWCDSYERNQDGLTEADTIWTAITELLEKEPSLFFLKRTKFISREGYTIIDCYTPDCRDEEFILRTVNTFRKHVYFPYVLYYKSDVKSEISYMHTPNGEFYRKIGKSRNGEFYRKIGDCRWAFVDEE